MRFLRLLIPSACEAPSPSHFASLVTMTWCETATRLIVWMKCTLPWQGSVPGFTPHLELGSDYGGAAAAFSPRQERRVVCPGTRL